MQRKTIKQLVQKSVVLPLCFVCSLMNAQNREPMDTSRVYEIDEVVLVDQRQMPQLRSTTPQQQLTDERLKSISALQVSDGLKTLSGVAVKDYGGIGGLKTVSVRSLGAAHTAVAYDGITINDMQSGQIDIGRFSLDNVKMLNLYNGQSDQILQPARQFASAAVLEIISQRPSFDSAHWYNGKVSLQGGSFGLFNPSLLFNNRISPHLSLSSSAEWMSANGAYPYTLDYGASGLDSSSVEHRKNSDVQNLRLESCLYGHDSVQQGYIKLYYYQSERGLPGATIFYNTENFSSQRLWDRNFFAQGNYQRRFAHSIRFMANAKYNISYLRYLDPTVHNSIGKEDSRYTQQELYASAGVQYTPLSGLMFSLNSDGSIGKLVSNNIVQASPLRYTWLTALAGKYLNDYVTATASLLSTYTHDEVNSGEAAKDYFKLSPYAGISIHPPFNAPIDLAIRAFYKNIFRMPTFNDLYYGNVGNRSLKPENTNQFNIGINYRQRICNFIPIISISIDGYHNSIENKIVAYPSKNLFTWTMLNYGKVSIDGLDINGEIQIEPYKGYLILLNSSYTYQRALNVTDPSSREYKHQIPYCPRVSGSGQASVQTPWFTLAYNIIWSGHRYAVNQNYAENRLPGYTDQSLALSHRFILKRGSIWANVACLNLANNNYSVVRYFPMPGRSWRATISYQF